MHMSVMLMFNTLCGRAPYAALGSWCRDADVPGQMLLSRESESIVYEGDPPRQALHTCKLWS